MVKKLFSLSEADLELLKDVKGQNTFLENDSDTFTELSMGMSEDWREAIAAGATMIRVGRAIFSDSFTE